MHIQKRIVFFFLAINACGKLEAFYLLKGLKKIFRRERKYRNCRQLLELTKCCRKRLLVIIEVKFLKIPLI